MVKIVRERYLNKINLKDKAQLQSFLSELYVFLTDQIHSGMKKVSCEQEELKVVPKLSREERLV